MRRTARVSDRTSPALGERSIGIVACDSKPDDAKKLGRGCPTSVASVPQASMNGLASKAKGSAGVP